MTSSGWRARSALPVQVRIPALRLLAVLGTVLLTLSVFAPGVVAAPATVTIGSDGLNPAELTVAPGTTVTWHNTSGERRRVRADEAPEEIDSGNIEDGEQFTHTFTVAGRYPYVDARNDEDARFFGTVVVVTDGDAGGGGDAGDAGGGGGGGGAGGGEAGAGAQSVSMRNSAFQPRDVSVPTGTTITWTNDDDRKHTVTAQKRSFDSGILEVGQQFSHTFTQPGTFAYVCELHAPDMAGTITVTGEPTGDPPPDPPPPAGGDGSGAAAKPDASGAAPSGSGPASSQSTPQGPAAATVTVADNQFQPPTVDVTTGATVEWVHEGASMHTITANDGSFDSGFVRSGDRFAYRFTEPGTFGYVCELHSGMEGTIKVSGEPTGEPPGPAGGVQRGRAAGGQERDRSSGGGDSGQPAVEELPVGEEAPTESAVDVGDFFFDPEVSTIRKGGTVTFTLVGEAPHTVTADDDSFDSDMLEPGQSWSHVFDEVGRYTYFCALHPDMQGVVQVVEQHLDEAGDLPVAADDEQDEDEDDEGDDEAGADRSAGASTPTSRSGSGLPPFLPVAVAALAGVALGVVGSRWRYKPKLESPG